MDNNSEKFLIGKELEKLEGEQAAFNESLEAEKFSFKHKLDNGMGERMMSQLDRKEKPSFILGLKYRMARRKTIRDYKKKERQLKRKIKMGDF